jgi:hypothetical protein
LGRPWEESDDFKVSIDADHSDMVKFTQFDQDGLVKALDVLRAFADEAIPVVENRVMKRAGTGMLVSLVEATVECIDPLLRPCSSS